MGLDRSCVHSPAGRRAEMTMTPEACRRGRRAHRPREECDDQCTRLPVVVGDSSNLPAGITSQSKCLQEIQGSKQKSRRANVPACNIRHHHLPLLRRRGRLAARRPRQAGLGRWGCRRLLCGPEERKKHHRDSGPYSCCATTATRKAPPNATRLVALASSQSPYSRDGL